MRDWREACAALAHPKVVSMLFLGLAAGLPLLLIFSSLSLWLREAGVDRAAVTFFSWAALGYSFKFVWAPLVDKLPVPWLTHRLGRRRAWMLLAQIAIILAILGMAAVDPARGENALFFMALAAVGLGFASATQDIVIDAYRIEAAPAELQALMSSTYIAGYRVGMLVAGAGALLLASVLGSQKGAYSYDAWRMTYTVMAVVMSVGVITTLIIDEPEVEKFAERLHDKADYLGFLGLFGLAVSAFVGTFIWSGPLLATWLAAPSQALALSVLLEFLRETLRMVLALAAAAAMVRVLWASPWVNRAMVVETYVAPIREFFQRYGLRVAWLLLALIGLYRISDIVLGVIANVFYQDLDFTKTQIATVVKSFGLLMTLVGGFIGGVLSVRFGVMRMLFVGAGLTVLTNLLFIVLALVGNSEGLLYLVISADNLSAGLASAAFIAFLSALTNVRFTAVQYAIFSSFMTLLPKLVGGYSGTVVDAVGYVPFFGFAALLGVPVLWLIWRVNRHVTLRD